MTSVSAWLRPGGCTITRTRSPALQSPCVCGWIDAHKQTDVNRVHLVLHFLPGEGEALRRRTLPNKRRAAPSMILSLLFNVEGFPSLCVCVYSPSRGRRLVRNISRACWFHGFVLFSCSFCQPVGWFVGDHSKSVNCWVRPIPVFVVVWFIGIPLKC